MHSWIGLAVALCPLIFAFDPRCALRDSLDWRYIYGCLMYCPNDTLEWYSNNVIHASISSCIGCINVCIDDRVCVYVVSFYLRINAHLVHNTYQTYVCLNVDGSEFRVHYLEINDPYRTWQESFKVDELENSTC